MKRFVILLCGYVAVAAIVAPAFIRPVPRLVWNLSPSVPIGLYRSRPPRTLAAGDLVAVMPPPALARLMAERHYLPRGVPMLKHVAARAGERICRFRARVTIGGKLVAQARAQDRAGRPLPTWQGCRMLGDDELFLLNPASEDSFDGRYFGAVSRRAIVAALDPLWLPGAASTARARRNSFPQANTKGANDDQNR